MSSYWGQNIAFTSFKETLSIDTNKCTYYIYGKETCPKTNKPHLQGFIILKRRDYSINTIKKTIGDPECHIEKCYKSKIANVNYCKKENNFIEWGNLNLKNKDNNCKKSKIIIIKDIGYNVWLTEYNNRIKDWCSKNNFIFEELSFEQKEFIDIELQVNNELKF